MSERRREERDGHRKRDRKGRGSGHAGGHTVRMRALARPSRSIDSHTHAVRASARPSLNARFPFLRSRFPSLRSRPPNRTRLSWVGSARHGTYVVLGPELLGERCAHDQAPDVGRGREVRLARLPPGRADICTHTPKARQSRKGGPNVRSSFACIQSSKAVWDPTMRSAPLARVRGSRDMDGGMRRRARRGRHADEGAGERARG